jgi:hypothetical protein
MFEKHFTTTILKSLVWCPGQSKRIAPLTFIHGCRKKRLIALISEIDCDRTAMGLPPVMSAVFRIAK